MKSKDDFASKFINALKGSKDITCDEKNEPVELEKMLNDIISIKDEVWGQYAFKREPLKGKFSNEERAELILKANSCGREEAESLRRRFGNIDIYEAAKRLGLKVDYPDKPNGGGHIIFAQFVEPNNITIFKDSTDKADKIIEEKSLSSYFSNVNIKDILLAHEVFHFIEENDDSLFTKTEKIRLWKIGPLKNDSCIVCLGEIAGMAFAKEFLKLNFSPYVLDVFLVYLYNKEAAYALYKEIMNLNLSI